MWLFGDRVDSSEIPSNRFTDWPDELARVGYETYGVIWLRLTPDGGLHLEHEEWAASMQPGRSLSRRLFHAEMFPGKMYRLAFGELREQALDRP